MPYVRVNGARLWYEDSGSGKESLVFSHGFLMDHAMFDDQVRCLADSYRCVRFDHRGQGRSEVTDSGYAIDELTEDAAALITALDCAPCHFAGLSMGGFVGLRLALRHPGLLKSLILMDTSADPEPTAARLQYTLMARFARWFGFRLLVRRISKVMFGRTFLGDPASGPQLEQWRAKVLSANRTGILRAVDGVLGRPGVYPLLPDIRLPVLLIVGDEDLATPPFRTRRMHASLAQSKLVTIAGAGHSPPIERPDQVTAAMLDFLVAVAGADKQTRGSAPEV
jgi:pimeloyl-ACP methyl ester carboxylesterase